MSFDTASGDWITLSEAVGTTGLGERTLQRYALKGKVARDASGRYLIPADLRRDRRDESQIVTILREEKDETLETIGSAANALERTTKALQSQIEGLTERLDRATRLADRRGRLGAYLLATSVATVVALVAVWGSLEEERATGRHIADRLAATEGELQRSKVESEALSRKVSKMESATGATGFLRRIALALEGGSK